VIENVKGWWFCPKGTECMSRGDEPPIKGKKRGEIPQEKAVKDSKKTRGYEGEIQLRKKRTRNVSKRVARNGERLSVELKENVVWRKGWFVFTEETQPVFKAPALNVSGE